MIYDCVNSLLLKLMKHYCATIPDNNTKTTHSRWEKWDFGFINVETRKNGLGRGPFSKYLNGKS